MSAWCESQCDKCHAWPEPLINVCCVRHAIWETRTYDGDNDIKCITELKSLNDLLKPGPLRVMYNNYTTCHGKQMPNNWINVTCCSSSFLCDITVPRYADAETLQPQANLTQQQINLRINAQRCLAAYRSVIFWTYANIRKKQRKPPPSCVYGMIRALFPSDPDEELWADLQHTVYTDGPDV